MEPLGINHLLKISDYGDPNPKKSASLSYWIDHSIQSCKTPSKSAHMQRDAFKYDTESSKPNPSFSKKAISSTKEHLRAQSLIQQIDTLIEALKNSPFKDDIQDLHTLKSLHESIVQLKELKQALRENETFTFKEVSQSPLIDLINAYYRFLNREGPNPIELLVWPQRLLSGSPPIIDGLIDLLSSHLTSVKKAVSNAENLRAKAAEKALSKPVCTFLKTFEQFGITNESTLFELAKRAALNKNPYLSEHIEKFHLFSEKHRIEIAKILAGNPLSCLGDFIEKFEISESQALLEIAQIAASTTGSLIAEHIEKFQITEEKDRIELAKSLASLPFSELCRNLEKFKITNRKALLEILTIAAKTPDSGLIDEISKLEFLTQKERIEIAKILAAMPNSQLAEFFPEFHIEDEQDRLTIAQIAANTIESNFARFIKNFEISKESDRIILARITANVPNSDISDYIALFNISSQEDLFEIAKIAAKQAPFSFSSNVSNFPIEDPKDRLQLLRINLRATKGRGSDIEKFDLSKQDEARFQPLKNAYLLSSENPLVEHCDISVEFKPFFTENNYAFLPKNLAAHFSNLDKKLHSVKGLDQFFLKVKIDFQKHLCLFIWQTLNDKALFAAFEPTILHILQYRNKEVAIEMSLAFSDLLGSPAGGDLYLQFMSPSHIILPMIFIINWALQTNQTSQLPRIAKILKPMRSLRDDLKLLPLLNTLISCHNNQTIPPEKRLELLKDALSLEANSMEAIKILGILSNCNLLEELRLGTSYPFDALQSQFSLLIQRGIFQFPETSLIKDFQEKYLPISDQLRIPFGLESYAANIQLINDTEVMEAIQKFVRSLCEDTFPELRYNTDSNPHLKAIPPKTLTAWKETANQVFSEPLPEGLEGKSSDDWQDLFLVGTETESCQNIHANPSLNKCLISYVLNGSDQILAIREKKTGKIKSRCILRLLVTQRDEGFVPVLFQERTYSAGSLSKEHEIALNHMAKTRAKTLGLELYTDNLTQGGERSLVVLESLGTNLPWEYVDGNSIGIAKDGVFSMNLSN